MEKIEKNVTIKDIAQEAGVSIGSVHRAIYGKKGVTEEVRQKILTICAERGYRANTAASALKRGKLRLVIAFPGPTEKSRYFYASVWNGFRRRIEEMHDFNLEIIETPYYPGTQNDQASELAGVLQRHSGGIDGLLTIGHFDASCKKVVRGYAERGIPVFLACDDTADCGRIACVQANYDATGRIVAELLASQLPVGSTVLLAAGDVLIPSHYRTVLGFEDYLRENRVDLCVHKINGYQNEEELRSRLSEALINDKSIAGAFSVSARLSVLLAKKVAEHGMVDQIRVIASDLFEETVANMEAGIVKNIIFKDPEQQAYLATKLMTDYLLKAEKPLEEIYHVESRVIFKSSLAMFV